MLAAPDTDRDADLFLRLNPQHVAIDEARLLPALFPALRVAIDADRNQPGRFVITGSSSPNLLRSISESLAGRIGIIEMAPLAWSEIHPAPAEPTFVTLLADAKATARDFESLRPRASLQAVHDYWFRGGYPEPWLKQDERFRAVWMEQYTRTYLLRDIARLFPSLDHGKFRLFLQMLGGLSGSVINYSDVSRALGVAAPIVRDYLRSPTALSSGAASPPTNGNAAKRIVKHPKDHLRDSGLLHSPPASARPGGSARSPAVGRSWGSMVAEEILWQLPAEGISHDHFLYRTVGRSGVGGRLQAGRRGDQAP